MSMTDARNEMRQYAETGKPKHLQQAGLLAEAAASAIYEKALELVQHAEREGVVVTIENRALKPLAMGNYKMEVSVRLARNSDAPEPAPKKYLCTVNGMPKPGHICGAVVVGGKYCGYKGVCCHQGVEA